MAVNRNPDTGGLWGRDSFDASQGLQATAAVPNSPGVLSEGAPVQQPSGDSLLDADDATIFSTIDALARSQEPLAKNRLAIDRHWTAIKAGYQFSSLTKQDNQNIFTQTYPPGMGMGLRTGAVPNKQADLCQKLTETLLVDPPKPNPEALTDDETAQRGSELARAFLEQDGSEAGMDDLSVYASQVERGTTRASVFNHYWTDLTGGGSVPKQVQAHPLATDPAHPLDAVDPMTGQSIPTVDYVERYVTADGQFTDNPSEAERVWLPKLRVDQLGREHVRLFPPSANLDTAQRVVVLWVDTVSGCRARFPEFFEQADETVITALAGWTPLRPSAIIPPALQGIWRAGRQSDPANNQYVGEERLVFFYLMYEPSCPKYQDGLWVAVNGANGGTLLHRDVLAATVEVPTGKQQDQTVTDTKVMDVPMAQLMLLPDAEDGDPTGSPFMKRVGGPGEAAAVMVTGMLEAIDISLHPARYAVATSPVNAQDVEASRATGDFVTITRFEDYPKYEEPRDMPAQFFPMLQNMYEGMDSSAGLEPPAQGKDDDKSVSGVARRIAVEQSLVAMGRMQRALHSFASRCARVKLQLAMRDFSASQLLRYVGEDGAAKQAWFTGNDFAQVGKVSIQTGTGTMLPPSERVNYALQLRDAMLIDNDTAMEIAQPAFAKTIGAPTDPHRQRMERQVGAWLEGPPEGWEEQAQAYQMQVVQHAQMAQQAFDMGQEVPPEPEAPWTPFALLPMDTEPVIAAMRLRRLGALMAKTEFEAQPPAWREVVKMAYEQMKMAAQPPVMPQNPNQPSAVTPPNGTAQPTMPATGTAGPALVA